MANEKLDYKVYIPAQLGEVDPGVYEIVSTNESYDTPPSAVDIIINKKAHTIHVGKYNWGYNSSTAYLVMKDFKPEFLTDTDKLTDEEARRNLDGLHHSGYSVDEFITEFGSGDVKQALKIAILNDWDAMPLTKARMDSIFINALKNRN